MRMVEFHPYCPLFLLRRSPSIRLDTPNYLEFPDFRGRRAGPAAKMDGMADDGEKKSKFTFERSIGLIGLIFVILTYFRPPDPAHPIRFDFLSHIVSIPLWLELAAFFGAIVITSLSVRWWMKRKTPSGPVVAMSANIPSKEGSYFSAPEPNFASSDRYHVAPTPAIITVELKTVVFEMDVEGLVIVLTNRGGSEARHIQVDDVHLDANTVRFSGNIDSLKPGASSGSLVPRVIEFKESNSEEIGAAMYQGIVNRTWGPSERYEYQGGAHFYDVAGNKWRASWTFTFFPHRYKSYVNTHPDDHSDLEPYLTVSKMSTMPVD